MLTKNWVKIKKLIALSLNIQLMISPLAFAEKKKGDGSTWKTIESFVGTGVGMGNQALNGYQNMVNQQMAQQQMRQMQQTLSIKPVDPTQIPPILSQNGCVVLQSRSESLMDGQKCDGQMNPEDAKSGKYSALMSIANQNQNDFANMLNHGHQRFTTQGVGCFEKAQKQFAGILNSRVEELNKLEASIKVQIENFEKAAEQDVIAMNKGNALLEGKPKKYLKDIKLQEQFKDPLCASFMDQGAFKNAAGGGYRAIESVLNAKLATPAGKSGLTPSELRGRMNNMKADIKKIALKIAKEAKREKNLAGFDAKKINVRTSNISIKDPAIQAIIDETQQNVSSDLKLVNKKLGKIIKGDKAAGQIMQNIIADSSDIDDDIYNYERSSKNDCFSGTMNSSSNFGGVDGFLSRLTDPNVSDKSNREADSSFKTYISSVLNNSEMTMEQKVTAIKKKESQGRNSRYSLVTGKSITIEGKDIGASTRLKASDMLSIVSNNCKRQFEEVRTASGKTKRQIMNALNNYRPQINKIHNKLVTKLQENIIKQMTDCPEDSSTGKAANSCGGALDSKGGGFCLRTANICAGNMMACADKAKKIVETTRAEQQVVATRYKENMTALKLSLKAQFKGTEKYMEASARQLDGMYQMGSVYNVPVGLDLKMLNDKLLKDMDPSLEIEDPKQYLAMMKKNIKLLKKQVANANDEILTGKSKGEGEVAAATKYGGFNGEIKKYKDNYKAEQKVWSKIQKDCLKKINQFNKMMADNFQKDKEASDEQYEKTAAICSKVDAFNQSPMAGCGSASDLSDEVTEILGAQAGSAPGKLNEYSMLCDQFNNDTENTGFMPAGSKDNKSVTPPNAKEICAESSKFPELKHQLSQQCKSYNKTEGGELPDCKISTNEEYLITEYCGDNQGIDACQGNNKTPDLTITILKKYIDTLPELLSGACKDPNKEADTKVEDTIKEYAGQWAAVKNMSELGEVQVTACNAGFNGQVGEKGFLDGLGQAVGRGIAAPSGGIGM